MAKQKKDNKHYISAKESKNIAKENAKEIKLLKKKRAAYKESDYKCQMKDDKNIVEFDNLHTYFYTDSGVGSRAQKSEIKRGINPQPGK